MSTDEDEAIIPGSVNDPAWRLKYEEYRRSIEQPTIEQPATPCGIAPEMIAAHVTAIGNDPLYIMVRKAGTGGLIGRHVCPATEMDSIVHAASLGQDCYFSPAIIQDGTHGNPPRLSQVECSGLVWLDRDGDVTLPTDLPPPSIVVRSGGGLHCLWRCSEMLTVEQTEVVNLALIRRGGGDPVTWNANRVLRIAGSWNAKRGRIAEIVSTGGPTYGETELLDLANAEDVSHRAKARAASTGGPVDWAVAITLAARYADMSELPDDLPAKARVIYSNTLPFEQMCDLLIEAGFIDEPYRCGFFGAMTALAASLKSSGMDANEIAGLLHAWRRSPRHPSPIPRGRTERALRRSIQNAIAKAYAPELAQPQQTIAQMFGDE